MTESAESADWDEVVDVLCVGGGPGVLAYAIACAAADLEVLIVESGHLDPLTRDWLTAMTADLDGADADPCLTLVHAEPVAVEKINDRTKLEPFVGEHLRQWSARCLASPFGVVFTHLPDLDPMRTADGHALTAGIVGSYRCGDGPPGPALADWLSETARGLFAPVEDRLDEVIIADGRIAGVVLNTTDGPCRVGVNHGLAVSVGAKPQHWPDQPELAGLSVDVAVLSRPAGRFATVGLLAR